LPSIGVERGTFDKSFDCRAERPEVVDPCLVDQDVTVGEVSPVAGWRAS
jgi:hypothetical protein